VLAMKTRDAFAIPKLAEVSPLYRELREKQNELNEERARLFEELGDLGRRENERSNRGGEHADRGKIERIAEVLGDPLLPAEPAPGVRTAEATQRINAIKEAQEELGRRIFAEISTVSSRARTQATRAQHL
jgi:hypothetical protein